MGVPTVTGVDDRRRNFLGYDVGCAGLVMAHHDEWYQRCTCGWCRMSDSRLFTELLARPH